MHHLHPRHIYTRTPYTQHTFSIIIQCHVAQINRHSVTKGKFKLHFISFSECIFVFLKFIGTCSLDSQILDHRMKLAEEVVVFRLNNSVDCTWTLTVAQGMFLLKSI